MDLEFRMLGPLEIHRNGRVVRLRGPKQRILLAALLLRANQVADIDYLVDVLWGESVPASAMSTLRSHVMRVRTALAGDGRGHDAMARIVTYPAGYLIVVRPGELDLHRFDRAVAAARAAGDGAEAAARYRHALGVWRGAPLADVPSERLHLVEVPRLEQCRLTALQDCIDAELGHGRDRELVAELRALVGAYPYRERLVQQLMLALYRAGQQVDALDVYRVTARQLAEELGLTPGPELRLLHDRILRQDPGLAAPALAAVS